MYVSLRVCMYIMCAGVIMYMCSFLKQRKFLHMALFLEFNTFKNYLNDEILKLLFCYVKEGALVKYPRN